MTRRDFGHWGWCVAGILALAGLGWAARGPAAHQRRRRRYIGQTWTARPYAHGLAAGDVIGGEVAEIREAAEDALGDYNGTAVVVNPNNGQILAMVNQKLALSAQYAPCSTTKIAIALDALAHGIINENTPVRIGFRRHTTLTRALAYSINSYFEAVGRRLGFADVSRYERELGLGAKVGWDIPGEQAGVYPTTPPRGGVAKLCSFGAGIHISPLQLASIVATIANGGTMYWLQHPRTAYQAEHFVPRVRGHIAIARLAPAVRDGMMAAVDYGTARGAYLPGLAVLGKTGTCSRGGTRFGLFASYVGLRHPSLVVVVILRGNGMIYGPKAAHVAGEIYRRLDHDYYFADNRGGHRPNVARSAAAARAQRYGR
ncbi:MAG: penicillin-binding transpeptidase domain-containing protein [Terriglobales bacterium]